MPTLSSYSHTASFPSWYFLSFPFFGSYYHLLPLASYVTLQAFISLQGKLIAWENLKKNVAGDTSGLASLIEHLHMNRGRDSSPCQRRKKRYEKHPPDICVSDVSHTFLTLFIADLPGSSKQAFPIHASGLLLFWSSIFGPTVCPSFPPARPSSGLWKSIFFFSRWMTKIKAACACALTPR